MICTLDKRVLIKKSGVWFWVDHWSVSVCCLWCSISNVCCHKKVLWFREVMSMNFISKANSKRWMFGVWWRFPMLAFGAQSNFPWWLLHFVSQSPFLTTQEFSKWWVISREASPAEVRIDCIYCSLKEDKAISLGSLCAIEGIASCVLLPEAQLG